MFRLNRFALSALTASFLILSASNSALAQPTPARVKNIVLVHGAFADGSSWSKVVPLLQDEGLQVIAVQNPLTSLKDDVAATKRAIAMLDGPVLLVGHSWAGVVFTEAGNDPKVVGLMYVSGLAPNDGQSLSDVPQTTPPPPGNAQYKLDDSGFQTLTLKGLIEDFAQDVPASEAKVMFATQGPWAKRAVTDKVTKAAWKAKPSWVIIDTEDRMIKPDMERAAAIKMKATTIEIKASHVPMVSQPRKVADFIIKAARSLSTQPSKR